MGDSFGRRPPCPAEPKEKSERCEVSGRDEVEGDRLAGDALCSEASDGVTA